LNDNFETLRIMKYSHTTLLMLLAFMPMTRAQEDAPPAAVAAVDLATAAQRSPAVAAILDAPRETPAQTISAVFTLVDLREFDVAEELLKTVADAGLSAADQAELVREFGTARFLVLSRESKTHNIAGGSAFAEAALASSAEEAAKPERISQLIADLDSDSTATRQAARSDLAATGTPAAQAMLEALAASTDKQHRTNLLAGLVEMAPTVNPLVIAALADGQGQFRRDVAELAGHLHLLEAIPSLATIAAGGDSEPEVVATAQAALTKMGLSIPNAHDALAVVKRELEKIDADIPSDSNPYGAATWWKFLPERNTFDSQELTSCEYRTANFARVAHNLLHLSSATDADRQLAIIAALEAGGLLATPSQGLAAQLASLAPDHLNSSLAMAIKSDRIFAAISIAQMMAGFPDPALLESLDGTSAPLAQAIAHPNHRLKFAALQALMKINPNRSFPGASYVPEALWQIAQSAGPEQAVVGAPVMNHANHWAGNLRALDFEVSPARTGVEIVQQALAAPRVAMILVDSNIGTPLLRETIYQLRAQPRLARVPIAVLNADEDLYLGEQLAKADKRILSVSRPRSPEAMKAIVERLATLADPPVPADERKANAIQAIEWLGELLASAGPYDEMLRDASVLERAVYNPALTETTLKALANVGTAGAQRTLVDFASQSAQPMELRKLAAQSFTTNREKFGVLLSTEEIAIQYDRYNASETASADVQELLGALLDTLELKPQHNN
jgi:hypothetical protein